MDLRKIKTVFIVVLIIINILLTSVLHNTHSREREIENETGSSVSYFLQKNMIDLAPKLSLPKSPRIYNFYLERMSESNEMFVNRFLEGGYTDVGGGVYKKGDKTLTVGGNEFKLEIPNPGQTVENLNAKAVEELCRKKMDSLGINPDYYKFGGMNFIDNNVKVIFTLQYDDSVFFDAYISFDVTNQGIISITGKNLISDITASGRSAAYISIGSVLMDIIKNPLLDKNKRHTIVSIKSGYYIGGDDGDYRNILAIPVWQIATDSGSILYYDARNGNAVSEK